MGADCGAPDMLPPPLPSPEGRPLKRQRAGFFQVDYTMHAENRARVVERFRADALAPKRAVLLLQGGASEERHDSDHELIFRQESSFHYLFGVKEPDCFGSIDVGSGETTLYVPRLKPEYAVWMGKIQQPGWFAELYGVEHVLFVDELEASLTKAAPCVLYTLHGLNTDSGSYAKPASFPGIERFRVDNGKLFREVVDARVLKTPKEIALMRHVNEASGQAHMETMRRARAGMKEFQLEAIFRYWTYYHYGCRNQAYTSICGCGPTSAVLHYGHAGAPNDNTVPVGGMCLLDMGAEYHCYASDITCSFPASGKFSDDQRFVYETVLEAQDRVMHEMKPGVSWVDMHTLAYRVILERLVSRGVLRGGVEEMLDRRVNMASYFMPHGLGHMIGIDTHDVGGIPWDTERPQEQGYKSLRCIRRLEENMVLTVEPGCYFIDHLMDQLTSDPNLSRFVDKAALDKFRGFGGVRLEDCVLVKKTGIENFTACPRTVEEVEGVMSGKITELGQLRRLYHREGEPKAKM